jgi:hypothetical protein
VDHGDQFLVELCRECPWYREEGDLCAHPRGPSATIPHLRPPETCPIRRSGGSMVVRLCRTELPEEMKSKKYRAVELNRFHVVITEGGASRIACRPNEPWSPLGLILVDSEHVPVDRRCQRTACKKRWP